MCETVDNIISIQRSVVSYLGTPSANKSAFSELWSINVVLVLAGYHSLYSFYHTKEGEHFPDPTGLRARIEYWTMGFYPACIKYLMAAFDVPEVLTI